MGEDIVVPEAAACCHAGARLEPRQNRLTSSVIVSCRMILSVKVAIVSGG
jgi:hypothetical protein